MMLFSTLLLLSAPSFSLAFGHTSPLLAWSSHNHLPPAPGSDIFNGAAYLKDIIAEPSICSNDVVVLIDQPGLHASEFRRVVGSPVLRAVQSAQYAVQHPYTYLHSAANPLDNVADLLTQRCASRRVHWSAESKADIALPERFVISVSLPDRQGSKSSLLEDHDSHLSLLLDELTRYSKKHTVVYAGWQPSYLERRDLDLTSRAMAPNGTAHVGILKQYQLLNSGLITSLLVVILVLVPVIFSGVTALANIQSPLKTNSATFNAQDKKNQ